jgi:DNA-binding CsgD family transcriptional regulator
VSRPTKRMSDQDHSLSELVGAIYDGVLAPDTWPATLERIATFVGGSSALLFHTDFRARDGEFLHAYGADPLYTQLYFERYLALNPVVPFMSTMEVGTAAAFSRVIDDDEELRSSVFYKEWMAPQNYVDVVIGILERGATRLGMVGVSRTSADGVCDDAALERMSALVPHIRRAVSIGRTFEATAVRVDTYTRVLEKLGFAVVLLDVEGQVVFANAAGRAMAEADDFLGIRNGGLHLRDPEAARHYRAMFGLGRAPTTSLQMAVEFVLGRSGDHPVVAQFLPLAAPEPLEALARAYALTPRELQVFVGIMRFGGVTEVARTYGISPTTVRTHLQNIFDKTGVRRQADLARIASAFST